MKILRVGDPHVKVSNLQESEALMNFVFSLANQEKVNRIELLGDLFHTHAVLRLEVIQFWEKWLVILNYPQQLVVLEGNHDQSGDYNSEYSALSMFKKFSKPNLHVITSPTLLGPIGYVPYMHDGEKFIEKANELAAAGAKVLVVHQTLMGSKYESGIYAHDGIDSEKISKEVTHVISGHIHSQQSFGRIDYPGTARWDTAADANLSKGVWIYVHDDVTGAVIDKQFVSTEKVCSPLYQLTYREGESEPLIPANARVTLELIGSSAWIQKEKSKFKGKVHLKSKITDSKNAVARKTGKNFQEFLNTLFTTSMNRTDLESKAKEWGLV